MKGVECLAGFPHERIGSYYVIRLAGEMDELAAESFKAQVDEAVAREPIQTVVVVMKDVTFIDSSGLGALLGRYKRLQAQGRDLCIAAPPPAVRSLLELSGVPKLITIYGSEGQALNTG